MILSATNECLELNYVCKTKKVSYSIADFVGNVIKCGNYKSLTGNQLFIHDLPKGIYMLCIIDGDTLCQFRFSKN